MPMSPADNPFLIIFSLAFLVALTGAMAPGPLLTYTIVKSAGSRRGYLTGIWVIAGHALVEMVIVVLLLFGFSHVLQKAAVVRGIGVAGGVILTVFGLSIIRDVFKGKISTVFMENGGGPAGGPKTTMRRGGLENPVIGGILVSMANPYWWVWWATIGSAFIVQFDITLENRLRLLAFFLGHAAGDLIWYLIISVTVFFGLRRLHRNRYYGVLVLCGIFMIGFGAYLGISPFFNT